MTDQAKIEAAKTAFAELDNWLEDRADADHPIGALGPQPNDEMRMLGELELVRKGFAAQAARIKQLEEALERDRSAVAIGVANIKKAIAGREHLRHPGRGSYAYDDDRYQQEFGHALDEIEAALSPLARIACDWSDCPTDPERIAAARKAPEVTNG